MIEALALAIAEYNSNDRSERQRRENGSRIVMKKGALMV